VELVAVPVVDALAITSVIPRNEPVHEHGIFNRGIIVILHISERIPVGVQIPAVPPNALVIFFRYERIQSAKELAIAIVYEGIEAR
jgi:hypothetical protein